MLVLFTAERELSDGVLFGFRYPIAGSIWRNAGLQPNRVAKGIAISKGQGPAPAQPGKDPDAAALYTVVASGPTLLAYITLAKVWPLLVLGYAWVVDSVLNLLTAVAPELSRQPVHRWLQ